MFVVEHHSLGNRIFILLISEQISRLALCVLKLSSGFLEHATVHRFRLVQDLEAIIDVLVPKDLSQLLLIPSFRLVGRRHLLFHELAVGGLRS